MLDESIPRQLGSLFPDSFETQTVQRMGWTGSKNGDLLRLAADYGFYALLTPPGCKARGVVYAGSALTLFAICRAKEKAGFPRPFPPRILRGITDQGFRFRKLPGQT